MMVTTPAATHSATADPPAAGANRPSMTPNQFSATANLPSTPPNQPSTGADRTGWFGAMTKKNAI